MDHLVLNDLEDLELDMDLDVEQPLNMNLVQQLAEGFAQPAILGVDEREEVIRNEEYYEITVPAYSGSQFQREFRMQRPTFEVSIMYLIYLLFIYYTIIYIYLKKYTKICMKLRRKMSPNRLF